jgi:hypothetical protein
VAFQVPVVSVPTPVIPVYDPDTRADATVPLERLDALIADIPEPFPETVVNVPTFAAKEPSESRRTIVDAPLDEEAVVLALAIVPALTLDALIEVIPRPAPIRLVAETFPAVE